MPGAGPSRGARCEYARRYRRQPTSGAAYDSAFTRRLSEAVNQLPWHVVQDRVKELKGTDEMATPSFLAGMLASDAQPMVEKSGAVDNHMAWEIVALRVATLYDAPLKGRASEVLQSYITKNSVVKPDIWEAREVTLTAKDKLTPVLIGIWDSGVDISDFPQQLYSDPSPDWHDPHGLAFDDQGEHSKSLLLPIPESARKEYVAFLPTLTPHVSKLKI